MTFNDIAKSLANGEKIFNLPLKVVFYARVSTGSDVQLNSLENQLSYYENYIKEKPNWTYIDGYVDEGISGVRVYKRASFKKMIEDAKQGKFDLIITKEVSRFARDLEDSIHYIRILKENNVGIYFENQNLNTFDSNSELVLNIMFNLAQDESKKLSARVKFGHHEAIKNGHVLGSSNITGYKKNHCKLVIDEKEALVIKKIFELYATGKYGFYKLGKKLKELGFYNKKGNIYDKDTLKRIIKNPKYKGYYRGRTSETVDYRTKKRIKIKEESQVIYKALDNIIPPIVSEELWNKANEVLKNREKTDINTSSFKGLKYPLSSKIYCHDHNTPFQRSHGNKSKNRPTWSCSSYLKYRTEGCLSPIIPEIDLYNIIKDIMKNILPKEEIIINNMLSLYENIAKDNDYDKEIKDINKNLMLWEDKKSLALEMVLNGQIPKDSLKEAFKRIEKEISFLNKRKEEIKEQIKLTNLQDNKNFQEKLQEELDNDFVKDFIRVFLEKIIVYKINNDRYNIKLDIYLNLQDLKTKDILYMENKTYTSIEKKRKNHFLMNFTYNVYIKE